MNTDDHPSLPAAYSSGLAALAALTAKITAPAAPAPALPPGKVSLSLSQRPTVPKVSNMTKSEFLGAVAATKEHIQAGDIFQLVLSQRFERRTFADPFEIYRALRVVNPSPYMAYLQVRVKVFQMVLRNSGNVGVC